MISELLLTTVILANLGEILSFFGSIFIFMTSKYFNYYLFDTVSDSVNTKNILNKIKENGGFISKYSINDGKKEPDGLCISVKNRYLCFIQYYNTSNNFNSKKHAKLMILGKIPVEIKSITNIEDCGENDNKVKKQFVTLYLSSAFYDGDFKKIMLPFDGFEPLEHQQTAIDNIKKTYDENKFNICRSLVWGDPKRGKSFIGKLLAAQYKSAYCFDIKLDSPGTHLLKLWETYKPERDKPLIVQIDEFDILISNIHDKNIKHEHDWLKTIVYDKQSYNTFMSEYLICLPYVIYLFTMNTSPETINKLDTSYIRQNRIDTIINL